MIGAALARAVASLRARPAGAFASFAGLALASLLLGVAATTGYALASGFERAQAAARTADVIARFDRVPAASVRERAASLANVADLRVRAVVRPVDIGARRPGRAPRVGTAELNALEPGTPDRDGLAIVAGHGLSGASGEVVIERGLARAWQLAPGDRLQIRTGDGIWRGHVVGISIEPDDVAFPLASRPRVYLSIAEARRVLRIRGGVNALHLRVHDRARLPETLVQARSVSYGLRGLVFTTRVGVRALVAQVSGLVVGLLEAFALIAIAAAAAMLAASSHARVTRDLATIGALRAIGFGGPTLALSYAIEAMVIALPASTLGVLGAALLLDAPTARLVEGLNELAPPHAVGWPQLTAIAGSTVVAAIAAAAPVFAAARRPVTVLLRGSTVVAPRRAAVPARPVLLGARLATARPLRLATIVLALAISLATVMLMLSLGRFLLRARDDPSILGEHYALVVRSAPGVLERVRAVPGVAAAAERWQTSAADLFDLREPVTLVAFGALGADVFRGRPLLEGRRASGPGEAVAGRGLAQSLGLTPGATLAVAVKDGAELRLRVTGIVQELARDGRVAYVDAGDLTSATPNLAPQIAVRIRSNASVADVRRRLERAGFDVVVNAGLAPDSKGFLTIVVALLRAVAVIDGLVCSAIVFVVIGVLARERARTIAVLRTAGATTGQVAAVFAGAAAAHLALALPLGWLLERAVLAPTLSAIVARYGDLPLAVAAADLALVTLGATFVASGAALVAARRYTSVTVAEALRVE